MLLKFKFKIIEFYYDYKLYGLFDFFNKIIYCYIEMYIVYWKLVKFLLYIIVLIVSSYFVYIIIKEV